MASPLAEVDIDEVAIEHVYFKQAGRASVSLPKAVEARGPLVALWRHYVLLACAGGIHATPLHPVLTQCVAERKKERETGKEATVSNLGVATVAFQAAVQGLWVNSTGSRMAVLLQGGRLTLCDVEALCTGRIVSNAVSVDGVSRMQWHPSKGDVYAVLTQQGQIKLSSGETVIAAGATSVAWDAAGHIVAGTSRGELVTRGESVAVAEQRPIHDVVPCQTGTTLCATVDEEGSPQLWLVDSKTKDQARLTVGGDTRPQHLWAIDLPEWSCAIVAATNNTDVDCIGTAKPWAAWSLPEDGRCAVPTLDDDEDGGTGAGSCDL